MRVVYMVYTVYILPGLPLDIGEEGGEERGGYPPYTTYTMYTSLLHGEVWRIRYDDRVIT